MRFLLDTTRSCKISSRIVSCRAFFCRGGNSTEARHAPLDDVHRVEQGKPVGVFVGLEGSFVYETADGKVRHQQTIEFLLYQLWRLTAQYDLRAPQVSFQFVQGGFYFPALVIQGSEFFGGGLLRVYA
jgi:hypothetical protein